MNSKLLSFSLILLIIAVGCDKGKDDAVPTSIDVESAILTDANGNQTGTVGEISSQWKAQTFTAKELVLFEELDTANLNGKSTLAIVGQQPAYPNPFVFFTTLSLNTTDPFTGSVSFKYVIVDNEMRTRAKKVVNSVFKRTNTLQFQIAEQLPSGKYRIYFTLSGDKTPHYFQSWGNIWKN